MKDGNGAASGRVLLAGAIGNFVEWFDFSLYGYLATTIAVLFFPKEDPTAALLATFAIFGAGLIVRPLGGIAFGYLGDRIGRRPTLVLSVTLMSAATVAVGLLPGYAQIGIAAPVLLFLCRLVQGFSAGGEFSGATIFLVEHARPGHRGRYASYSSIPAAIGPMCAALVVVATNAMMSREQLESWGWRVPFLLAAPLALIGLYLRLRVEESPVFSAIRTEGRVESAPIMRALKAAKKPMLIMVGYAMANAVASYLLFGFLVSFLTSTEKFSNSKALAVGMVVYSIVAVGAFVAGRIIDAVGHKRTAVASALCVGAWAVPAFVLVGHSSLLGVFLIFGLFGVLFGGMSVSTTLALVVLFPARIRTTASGISYQIAYAVFGGSAPYLATWLVARGHLAAPGYYLASLCAVSMVVAALGFSNRSQVDPGYDATDTLGETAAPDRTEVSHRP
ncbi:MFS transporter [Nocardia sp. NPDC004711]